MLLLARASSEGGSRRGPTERPPEFSGQHGRQPRRRPPGLIDFLLTFYTRGRILPLQNLDGRVMIMPLPSRLWSLWRNLCRRGQAERDLQEEVGSFLELLTEEKLKSGLPLEAA